MQDEDPAYLTTAELAAYLRIGERRVYELVRQRALPCTRITGKWLFPRARIDQWLAATLEGPVPAAAPPPPVLAGSEDPLLDWAVKTSGCGLALLPGGSLDGLARLNAGEAMLAGLHVYDPDTADFNLPAIQARVSFTDIVVLTWARRRQGLVLPPGNPDGIDGLADLVRRQVPVATRQGGAGSRLRFEQLLADAGLDARDLRPIAATARGEMDLGLAVLNGQARAGFAIEAVARRLNLDFLPLADERFDLVLRRRAYFEPPVQALFATARSPACAAMAERLGGYNLSDFGRVQYNGP